MFSLDSYVRNSLMFANIFIILPEKHITKIICKMFHGYFMKFSRSQIVGAVLLLIIILIFAALRSML